VLYTLAWVVIIVAVFAPLAVRRADPPSFDDRVRRRGTRRGRVPRHHACRVTGAHTQRATCIDTPQEDR
jgi:hypothetical protein